MNPLNELEQIVPLPPPKRLALAYATPVSHAVWAGLLALDERLERVALGAREPMLGQIKLAWWRERFADPSERWPAGEPLLAMLRCWDAEREALAGLVDGWEGMVGGEPGPGDLAALVEARAGAMAGAARLLGSAGAVEQAREAGRAWAAYDLTERLGFGEARRLAAEDRRAAALPRTMRPLAVLAASARPGRRGIARLGAVIRVGLLGR